MSKQLAPQSANDAPAKTKTRKAARPRTRTLYFAYGANTCLDSMANRCPEAQPHGAMTLADHRLKFRGVADVVQDEGKTVHGALWWITRACEKALDSFEGYPHLYVKNYGTVLIEGVEQVVMFYVMRQDGPASPPYSSYLRTLRAGYDDFGLPQAQLDTAISEAPSATFTFRAFNGVTA